MWRPMPLPCPPWTSELDLGQAISLATGQLHPRSYIRPRFPFASGQLTGDVLGFGAAASSPCPVPVLMWDCTHASFTPGRVVHPWFPEGSARGICLGFAPEICIVSAMCCW
uniref:Uncharacterized protein n=1 Tax=Eutreptiella gymnastica TaxID=73025 RepID=A0A6T2EW76_9EUGL